MNPLRKEGPVLYQANEKAGWDGFKSSHYIWALFLKIILSMITENFLWYSELGNMIFFEEK